MKEKGKTKERKTKRTGAKNGGDRLIQRLIGDNDKCGPVENGKPMPQ